MEGFEKEVSGLAVLNQLCTYLHVHVKMIGSRSDQSQCLINIHILQVPISSTVMLGYYVHSNNERDYYNDQR